MKTPDVLIILGGGTDGTLHPVLYTKERLEGFLKLSKKILELPIIASGGYSIWVKNPKYSESEVIREYLLNHGINRKNIFLEKKSRDTIGNALFSKQIIKKHSNWRSIAILTTDGHIGRCRWIFGKIFGQKYKLSYIGIPSELGGFKNDPERKKYEKYLIDVYKRELASAKNGGDLAIAKLIKRFHPAYAKTKKAKMIQEEIKSAKERFLGYSNLANSKRP